MKSQNMNDSLVSQRKIVVEQKIRALKSESTSNVS